MTGHRFGCTLCGDCCTGAQVVRLTAGDLTLLVRRLGLPSVGSLRATGLVSMVQEAVGDRQVWRPRIRFRTKPLRQCPFLANDVDEAGVYRGLCTLHPHDKPLVCALSPLTRSVESDGPQVLSETWAFVPPVDGCPGVGIGDVVDLGPPSDLRPRLDDEVLWMHRVLNETGNLADEDAAWAWLDNQGSLGVP